MNEREALKLALEALENTSPLGFNMESDKRFYAAITAIREALAQPLEERNFCPRCGKRVGKNDWDVHTCSLPEPERCKYGYEPKSCTSDPMNCQCAHDAVLEMAEQEPYGYFQLDLRLDAWVQNRDSNKGVAFYTTPPQRTWVGLTDDDTQEAWDAMKDYDDFDTYTKFIEAKLKEKNT